MFIHIKSTVFKSGGTSPVHTDCIQTAYRLLILSILKPKMSIVCMHKVSDKRLSSKGNNVLPDQWTVCLAENLANVLLQLPTGYRLIPPFPYKIAFRHLPTEAVRSLRTQHSVTDNVYHFNITPSRQTLRFTLHIPLLILNSIK